MSNYGAFVRGGEHTDDVAQQQSTNGTGVVILAPKQAPQPAGAADARPSTILNIRKALQKSTGGRAQSPDLPPAGRRRASPTYETFKPRGSPTYEPVKPRTSPSYQPHSKAAEVTAGLGHAAGQQDSAAAKRSGSRSRSTSSRCRSSSHSRSRSRHRHRHRHRQRSNSTERRHRSRSSSKTRRKAKRRSSRDSRRSKRHKHSRSQSRSRSRSRGTDRAARSRSRDRRKSHRHEHSRHFSRSDRQRSASPVPFSRHEKGRAWADERAFNTVNPARRGKQGLGFAGDARLLQHRPEPADAEGDLSRQRSSRGVAAASRSSKWVSALDAAAVIPGYNQMAPAEKLKARMRLVLSKAEQQSAAAEAATAGAVAPSGLGDAAVASVSTAEGWTRFVFGQHGELDEDKHARQKLMDSEVGQSAMGGFGNAADDTVDTAAAFIMGTGRVAAQQAGLARAAEAAHDDAIFGRPYGASSIEWSEADRKQHQQQDCAVGMSNDAVVLPLHNGSAAPEHGSGSVDSNGEDDAKQLAASLTRVSELLVVEQQRPGLSWRDKALAMRAKRQQ